MQYLPSRVLKFSGVGRDQAVGGIGVGRYQEMLLLGLCCFQGVQGLFFTRNLLEHMLEPHVTSTRANLPVDAIKIVT